jgi:putative selenate reductase
MAELLGLNLDTHLKSILAEYKSKESIYGYPKRKFFLGFPGYDFSVDFHDKKAATVLGPASGPHTQMVQNIILSFLGGGRIMELKTVQILDRLEIPRPCIDVRNIGFNVEWSQELRLEDSLREYLTAWALLKIIEDMELLGIPKGDPFYHTVFDISVGYDLKGISSPPVNQWLKRLRNAEKDIAEILDSLTGEHQRFKTLKIDPNIADSATLSTFHGCPRDEIEKIVEHLISEHGLHTIVKMNPTILGYDFARRTLDGLGYKHIELDPAAFSNDLQFSAGVEMMKRLQKFAQQHQRRVGAKFTNTLVVKNNEAIFSDKVMYLSGAPLHVISMNAMQRFRSELGEDFHISFSAGIAKHNFVDAVLCNMRPITVCTDLLKTGGYTRLYDYLENLQQAMEQSACRDMEEFIIQNAEAPARQNVFSAGMANARRIVPQLIHNPRYHYENNKKPPKKIDSHLTLFDCITCNKCLPVCPNAANFSIPGGAQKTTMINFLYSNEGYFIPLPGGEFELKQKFQIANLADFCNECGDCDTYCPEYGGPFIAKPRFFFSEATYRQFQNYDGFYFFDPFCLKGRINGKEYLLAFNPNTRVYLWQNGQVEFLLKEDHTLVSGIETAELPEHVIIDMQPYYTMRTLLDGVLSDPQAYTSVMLRGVE